MTAAAPRVAVVGHVEWVVFAAVPRLPAPGEIVHASSTWDEAAGGGGVAAVQLARMAGRCEFFTAGREPALGRLRELGVIVHAADRLTRRAFTHTDAAGERTITVLDERVVPHGADPLPWERLGAMDGAYFTGGDGEAARSARAARVLVATPRGHDGLRDGGVVPDVLVLSGNDAQELEWAEGVEADRTVYTDGPRGGRWIGAEASGTWRAAPLPGPVVDAYGCGDSFAAGLTLSLAAGRPLDDALAFGAACGAAVLTGRGPYGAPLPSPA